MSKEEKKAKKKNKAEKKKSEAQKERKAETAVQETVSSFEEEAADMREVEKPTEVKAAKVARKAIKPISLTETVQAPAAEKPVDGQEKEAGPVPSGRSKRTKERSEKEMKDLLNRLSRVEGQIRGIKRMVEEGAYCPDILVQSAAANAALNSFNKVLLAEHIRTCVSEDIREGRDETVDELVVTLQKLMK